MLEAGIVPGNIMAVSSYLAILACVSAGAGYAVVPRSVLDTVSTQAQFRTYVLPESVSRIKTLIAWRSDYTSAKLDALKELLPVHSTRRNRHGGTAGRRFPCSSPPE